MISLDLTKENVCMTSNSYLFLMLEILSEVIAVLSFKKYCSGKKKDRFLIISADIPYFFM